VRSRYFARLVTVAIGAAAADQATKLLIRATLTADEHRHLALGIGLTRIERTEAGSATGTYVVAALLVLAALIGALLDRPRRTPATWLTGGLLIGGAGSSFVELAVTGSTTVWLTLPLHAVVSLSYLEMLAGALGLFFHIGRSRRRPGRPALTNR